MTPDEIVKEHLSNGGKLITVTKVDSYRDGGTKVIQCGYATKTYYYIDKNNYTIHTGYPTTEDNIVPDSNLKQYIISELLQYNKHQYADADRVKDYIRRIV
jgi:hypothetical protein